MDLICLSKGNGFYFPPCYMVNICGLQILVDCPMDLSALSIFSPITYACNPSQGEERSDSTLENSKKRRKIERTLQADDLICAEPWYKTVLDLHLYDVSLINVVLISSSMGMLGLPFLTRNKRFSAKVYATEVSARFGRLMMEDLVAMNVEFRQFYGSPEKHPHWMKWDALESMHDALKEVVMGEDGAELGNWQPLYSAVDIKDCMQRVQTLKYGEEAYCDGTLVVKVFSSGLELGASNWVIDSPKINITFLSSSIFESPHTMGFDYHSIRGSDIIVFSDFSSLHSIDNSLTNDHSKKPHIVSETEHAPTSIINVSRDDNYNDEEFLRSLHQMDDLLEEADKIAFICSCAMDCIKEGGSVLLPIGRLGIILQLLEQLSLFLTTSNIHIPIFIISTVADETFGFTNIIPEWVCKQRQEKLYAGEPLFGHAKLMKEKKLQLFSVIHSSNLILSWEEPCIVFSPHWSLRTGPVVHFLHRWHEDPNSLLVLEEGLDANLSLLPFKPIRMKVLQCAFLSGIKISNVHPLLKLLSPRLVLIPQELRDNPLPNSDTFLFYSESENVHVVSLENDIQIELSTDLAFSLDPKKIQENKAVARLKGEVRINHGKYTLMTSTESKFNSSECQLLHWGLVDPNQLLEALKDNGIDGVLDESTSVQDDFNLIIVDKPDKAKILLSKCRTVISTKNQGLADQIFKAFNRVASSV